MKCDELKPIVFSLNELSYIDESAVQKNFENPHDHAVYKATEVDAAIDELKSDVDAAIDDLKKKLEDAKATAYAESVDAGMRERRLRRLLWHAIALFCARSSEYFSGIMSHCFIGQKELYELCEEKKNKYLNAMYKCRKKMEKYK